MKKFFVRALLIALLMSLSLPVSRDALAVNSHTRNDALAWASDRASESWWYDVDGSYGCQCVDLIMAYYDYLVGYHASGNACDYSWNSLPNGWVRSGTPAPGAVVVWGAGARMGEKSWADGNFGHVGIVVGTDGSTLTTVETNAGGSQNAKYMYSRYASTAACFIHPDFAPDNVVFSLDGYLDGVDNGYLTGYGTCDVYINGVMVADDVVDYYSESVPKGSSYAIKDIRLTEGHYLAGIKKGSLSGTLTEAVTIVQLSIDSLGTIAVQGLLDGVVTNTIAGYGTFDVMKPSNYPVRQAVSEFTGTGINGYSNTIQNIQACDGKYYLGHFDDAKKITYVRGKTQYVILPFCSRPLETTLKLPENLKAIGDEAFMGVEATDIFVPDGCESIGSRAFAGNTSLKYITIPASVKEIASDAFEGCNSLTIRAPRGSAAAELATAHNIPYFAIVS